MSALLRRYVPIVGWLPSYDRRLLTGDAVAGLSVWALLVPQALAYASLAGVPAQYGLYTSFVALVAYAIFGTSRHLAQGPSAAVCAVSAAAITPIIGSSALGSETAIGWTAALAIATGLVYLALGVLRMGWVSTFLSKAVMAGFVLGFSIGIIIDQSQKLLGVDAGDGSYAQELWEMVKALPDTSTTTLAVGLGSLAVLLAMRRFLPRWPRMLMVVAAAIALSAALDLSSHGVAVTGHVPTGLPSVGLPGVGWSETSALLVGALSIVFVGYSESLASARAMASRHHYEIDTDQELIAQGFACGAAGFVGGFASDGSLSKTSVAEAAGQQTQMASLVNAVLVLLTMLLLAGLFEDLPSATLGAVVIDAMVGLVTFVDWRRYYRVNRADWVFFMGAGVGILFIGITQGILIGVVLSLLLLIARSSRTSVRELGRDPRTGRFHVLSRHEGLELTPGVRIARVDGPLFFADADAFRTRIREISADAGTPGRVIVDAEAVLLTDTDGADILAQVAGELASEGSTLELAAVHPPVLALWRRAGLIDAVGEDAVFATVEEAVAAPPPIRVPSLR
ncbi:putative sulfate transporter [Baekduia alba]|uniref:SulP family inorganic anion transporter n=1 Tax=Baekduia alba TaxID=2997333 RepID=UPI0023407B67|nr:sulfate permease [Baekduia alba]WCB95202.1 putative sulfate transporter [Baekduia alba]